MSPPFQVLIQVFRENPRAVAGTRVAMLFPNEALLLRFAFAVLSEISDDWEADRAYLTMDFR